MQEEIYVVKVLKSQGIFLKKGGYLTVELNSNNSLKWTSRSVVFLDIVAQAKSPKGILGTIEDFYDWASVSKAERKQYEWKIERIQINYNLIEE